MSGTRLVLAILAAGAAIYGASELMVRFHDWNREQACATAGGRNCLPAGPVKLQR